MGPSSASHELELGRESYARSAWATAYESLAHADGLEPLRPEDLVLFGVSAYMLGHEDEWMRILERACHEYKESGEMRPAARCAFWIGINLALRGEMGPATGWLGRAQRLLEPEGDCVERGYLLRLVQQAEPLPDTPSSDENLALRVYCEREEVFVPEALADFGRGRSGRERALVVARRLVLEDDR